MAKLFNILEFNNRLASANQTIQAVSITVNEIILSNGVRLIDKNEVIGCKRRVASPLPVWREHFDLLYSVDHSIREAATKKCKSFISKLGGIACQLLHGERLTANLNTGTPWNANTKGNYPYSNKLTADSKEKISKANSGESNGMYGRKMSEEDKDNRSKIMKQKILDGVFTPNSNNRNTHWESTFSGKKYRSSWEALYQYLDPLAEYEKLRIPYTVYGKEKIYIVDFINYNNNTVIEVKPQEFLFDDATIAKLNALQLWAANNGYTIIIATQSYFRQFSQPIDLTEFDTNTQRKIKKLYETNK